jgi:hypothetical protein
MGMAWNLSSDMLKGMKRWLKGKMVALVCTSTMATMGCGDLGEDARAQISEEWSCPLEKIELQIRDDVDPGAMLIEELAKLKAPADIQADPARLAIFREKNEKDAESGIRFARTKTVVDVQGCGKSKRMYCRRRSQKQIGQRWHSCTDR